MCDVNVHGRQPTELSWAYDSEKVAEAEHW